MKIIEGMKQIKDLQRKASDLRSKVKDYAADLDINTPVYPDQQNKVTGWLQAHEDIVQEICRLRFAIQKTNIATQVEIDLGGKAVVKTISEWIQRRRDLAEIDAQAWSGLGHMERSGKLREGQIAGPTPDSPPRDVKLRRYYDPELRDRKLDLCRSEPLLVDAKLEVVNAITDLVE